MESENDDNIVAYSSGVYYNGSPCNPLFYLFLVIAYTAWDMSEILTTAMLKDLDAPYNP